MTWWRRGRWWLGGGIALIVALSSTPWPRDVLQLPLVVDQPAIAADVVVVLGGGTRAKDSNYLPPQVEQRVVKGVSLVNAGYASRLVMAGGPHPVTGLVEADVMAAEAIRLGLRDDQIERERRSRDTWQNATNTLAIMTERGWDSALVVTSPYHTWRACRMFSKQGGDVRCLAAPYNLVPVSGWYERFMDNRSVVREYGAVIYAWIQGRL